MSNVEAIKEKLARHAEWVRFNKEADGQMDSITKPPQSDLPRGIKANFFGFNMEGLTLNGGEFETAYMSRARLQGADLTHTKFIGADLSYA